MQNTNVVGQAVAIQEIVMILLYLHSLKCTVISLKGK